MKVKNSLSTLLEQMMILNTNSLETIDQLGNAISSTEDSIKLTLTDPNNTSNTIEYYIPSFGYLKSEIDRISASLNTMTNVTDGAGSRIRLSDGSYRKIIASKIPSEAPTITNVDSITNFNFKANWFFEDMLNPCLYITWDMSNQISPDTERVMIQRYILKCDTQAKIDVFNTNLKGRNDIDYKEFLALILNNKIKFTLDDEVKDLPPRSKRYYGTFSVIRIDTEKDLRGNSVKRYILDSLEFTDSRSGFENTRLLSAGDFVEVNSNPTTTRYEVIYVEASENKIGLKCVEGCEGVRVGADTLKISASQDTSVSADIPVGFDEREVIFVKAIDPDSNIPSSKWSPGVGFYSNELTYVDETGASQTLQRFYQRNVVDFGQVLLSYANDYYPSIREGITPDAPILNYANGEGDFKIVQINGQLTEEADASTFRSLVADKAKVQSELDNISNEIAKQKELIQTTQYTSTNEKLKAQSILSTLVSQQETLSSNYNSIVNNIKAKYESGNVSAPKYRIRGFWDMPEPKVSPSSGEQNIIKFKIRYRYLSEAGNSNREEEFQYSSGKSTVTGRFSNWNEIETKTRSRIKTTSGWEWESIDTADPDAVNINQLDIPINPGEQVEIQVKSVSEAGWPSNPMESEWSDSIIISFSDFAELQADDVRELIEQNKVDAAVANVTRMFQGTAAHMSSSFYTNDKYFAHSADSITSGFLSPEQTPISLYDKLQDLHNQLAMIKEQINGTIGDINVVLVDNSDDEKTYVLNEGSTTYINAGNYKDAISNVPSDRQNGAIVTKTFYLDISTEAQSGLFLLSKLSGNRLSMCPSTVERYDSITGEENGNAYEFYDNYITPSSVSSVYYNDQGRYDLVPINLTNPEILDFQIGSPSMYQSAQCRGQFVYSRFRNIGDTFDMYANNDKCNFNPNSEFGESEHILGDKFNNSAYYGSDINTKSLKEYNSLTGSEETTFKSEYYDLMCRLPKTWPKPESAADVLKRDRKILLRTDSLGNLVNEDDLNTSRSSTIPTDVGTMNGDVETKKSTLELTYTVQLADGNNADYTTGEDMKNPTITSLVGDKPSKKAVIKKCKYSNKSIQSKITIDNYVLEKSGFNDASLNIATIKMINAENNKYIKIGDGGDEKVWSKALAYTKIGNDQYLQEKVDAASSVSIGNDFEISKFPEFNCVLKKIDGGKSVALTLSLHVVLDVEFEESEGNVGVGTKTPNSYSGSMRGIYKLGKRIGFLTTGTGGSSSYTIIPKIQSAYGFADLGEIKHPGEDMEFMTTHKIGYEDRDRYLNGPDSCNSYLFLSPVNHNEIQVDGDTLESSRIIKNGESLRVPIIYQYRMTDYDNHIFGLNDYDANTTTTDLVIKNAKYANIIGIDIWTDRNAIRPKQYDIIVYSTYERVVETNTNRTKTSTQTLVNTGTGIVNKLDKLVKDNRSIVSKTNLLNNK